MSANNTLCATGVSQSINLNDFSQVRVLDVWRALGGPEPRRGRAPAFWRRSHDPNVSIDAERNVFYDHAQNRGGGVLALVETALDCSRPEALAWLEDEGFIEHRTLTRKQRREHAQRKTLVEPGLHGMG